MFRFAFQLSPKLCVIKPKLGSACLIPSADGRQIWFWGEGGKSAHSFVAVRFHTFYASLAFSQCIHRSNYPISMEWRIDSYSGKKSNAFTIFPGYYSPPQHPATSPWWCPCALVLQGCSLSGWTQRLSSKRCRWHVNTGSSYKHRDEFHVQEGTHPWNQNCKGSKIM